MPRCRHVLWIAVVIAAVLGAARADVVYTKDNRIYRGTVTRTEKDVIVQTDTKTVRIAKANVLHIVGTAPKPKPDPKPTPGEKPSVKPPVKPPTPATPKPTIPSTPAAPPVQTQPLKVVNLGFDFPTRTYQQGECHDPEGPLFMLMRSRHTMIAIRGAEADSQIQHWQDLTHERRRKVNNNWVKPEDFRRGREQFGKNLLAIKEAQQKAREEIAKARQRNPRRYTPPVRTTNDPKHLPSAVKRRLQSAATSWVDPLIRTFFSGMVSYKLGQYTQAAGSFRTCCREAPYVAGFWQGYSLALTGLKEHKAALAAAIQVNRLRPGDRTAMALLDDTMASVPGGVARTGLYEEANRILDRHGRPNRSTVTYGTTVYQPVQWLMPGRSWRGLWDSLPVPHFDRLRFLQGLGTPIGPTALLVDRVAVKGAVDVFVQVADGLVVPGRVRDYSYYGSQNQRHTLTTVMVQGYRFTPVEPLPADQKVHKGLQVVTHGLGVCQDMGPQIRTMPGEVTSVGTDGAATLSVKLLAGDVSAPVFTRKGQLAGYLSGKTNPRVLGGGKDEFVPVADLAKMIEQARRSTRSYGRPLSATKTLISRPYAVPGRTFVVYATFAESFAQKR